LSRETASHTSALSLACVTQTTAIVPRASAASAGSRASSDSRNGGVISRTPNGSPPRAPGAHAPASAKDAKQRSELNARAVEVRGVRGVIGSPGVFRVSSGSLELDHTQLARAGRGSGSHPIEAGGRLQPRLIAAIPDDRGQ